MKPAPTALRRFWRLVQIAGGCWLWGGSVKRNGYGQFNPAGVKVHAHRWAYEMFVGSIPEGLDLDHVCRRRNCVNPGHLEPVTRGENLRRGQRWPQRSVE